MSPDMAVCNLDPKSVRFKTMARNQSITILFALLISAIFLSLSITYINEQYTYDAVAYSLLITRGRLSHTIGPDLWHPYHIGFLLFFYFFFRIFDALGGTTFATFPIMQILSALATATSVFILTIFLTRTTRSLLRGIPGGILFGSLYVTIFYSTNPEVYSFAYLFILLNMYFVFGDGITKRSLVLGGLFLSFAISTQFASIFLLPFELWYIMHDHQLKERKKLIILFCTISLLLPTILYSILYGLSIHPFSRDVRHFLHVTSLGTVSVTSLIHQFALELKTLAHGIIPAQLPYQPLKPIFSLAGFAILFLLIVISIFTLLTRASSKKQKVLIACSIFYFVFYGLTLPGDFKFSGFILYPLIIVAFTYHETLLTLRIQKYLSFISFILAGALFFIQLIFILPSLSRAESNPYLQKALMIQHLTEPSDTIIVFGTKADIYMKVYIPAFAHRRTIPIDILLRNAGPDHVLPYTLARIGEAQTRGKVYLMTSFLELTPSDGPLYKVAQVFKRLPLEPVLFKGNIVLYRLPDLGLKGSS